MNVLPPLVRSLLERSDVSDVLVNDGVHVWAEITGQLTSMGRLRPGEIDAALERLLAPLGRRLDHLSPIVDARLDDGTRVCALIRPVATNGTCVAFRRFAPTTYRLDDFDAAHLGSFVSTKSNVLVSGATGSGKTSLVASLVDLVPTDERLVVIEDTREIVATHPHCVRLESRPATAEGKGQIALDDLVRASLRLRPDRLVVGEVRGAEATALVMALSTGHRGSLATIHADSVDAALERLEALVLLGARQWRTELVRRLIGMAFDAVVHVERHRDGRRRVVDVRTGLQSTVTR